VTCPRSKPYANALLTQQPRPTASRQQAAKDKDERGGLDDAVQAEAGQLAAEIGELLRARHAVDEVDTNLGVEVQREYQCRAAPAIATCVSSGVARGVA
jgi:hypothetical protein